MLEHLTSAQLAAVTDRRGWRPLHHAAHNDQLSAVEYLVGVVFGSIALVPCHVEVMFASLSKAFGSSAPPRRRLAFASATHFRRDWRFGLRGRDIRTVRTGARARGVRFGPTLNISQHLDWDQPLSERFVASFGAFGEMSQYRTQKLTPTSGAPRKKYQQAKAGLLVRIL
jgi:hypothetical protein